MTVTLAFVCAGNVGEDSFDHRFAMLPDPALNEIRSGVTLIGDPVQATVMLRTHIGHENVRISLLDELLGFFVLLE